MPIFITSNQMMCVYCICMTLSGPNVLSHTSSQHCVLLLRRRGDSFVTRTVPRLDTLHASRKVCSIGLRISHGSVPHFLSTLRVAPAEAGRFELPIGFPRCRLSKAVHSTTMRRLHIFNTLYNSSSIDDMLPQDSKKAEHVVHAPPNFHR
jgi:hypothetical protein